MLDADKPTDMVLEEDGATVTFTGNLKLDDGCEEQDDDEEDELEETVAV